MKAYELMLILDSSLDEDSQTSAMDKVKETITSQGGTVGDVDVWGKRQLAYEIDDKSEGIYMVLPFEAAPEAIAEVDRVLHITGQVIRFMITRKEHVA